MKEKIWNILMLVVTGISMLTAFIAKGALTDLKDLRGEVGHINTRLVTVEASRFTAADGMKIHEQLGDIKTSIARIEERIKSRAP